MYTQEQYNVLVEKTIEQLRQLSKLKGGEYAGDGDRLANFRRLGTNQELDMETIWSVYASKHWDAIQQYIKDTRNKTTRERLEPITGRADDLIVYLVLFKAMCEERGN